MKKHTISEWLCFFGIVVIDWDGFKDQQRDGFFEPISFDVFAKEICECTIRPVDKVKYANFLFLVG